jgi:hypothetical protein
MKAALPTYADTIEQLLSFGARVIAKYLDDDIHYVNATIHSLRRLSDSAERVKSLRSPFNRRAYGLHTR